MKDQIPESIDKKLVEAAALIEEYAELIYDLGDLIGFRGVVSNNSQATYSFSVWVQWYESFICRKCSSDDKD
jgi:hypothetical protein